MLRIGRPGYVGVRCHENTLIATTFSHRTLQERDRGWIYAYLLAPRPRNDQERPLWPHHQGIWKLRTSMRSLFLASMRRPRSILKARDKDSGAAERRYRLTLEAEAQFENAIGSLAVRNWGEQGFAVKASKSS